MVLPCAHPATAMGESCKGEPVSGLNPNQCLCPADPQQVLSSPPSPPPTELPKAGPFTAFLQGPVVSLVFRCTVKDSLPPPPPRHAQTAHKWYG